MADEAKKPMIPDFIRFPLVLGLVCIGSGASLSALYEKTKDRIEESRKRKLEAAFVELAAGYEKNEEKKVPAAETDAGSEFVYYRLLGAGGKLLGYGCETPGPNSYNSLKPIRAVTVIGPDLAKVEILGMRVSFSSETPGLGERIKEKPASNSIYGRVTGAPDRIQIVSEDVSVDVVRLIRETESSYEVAYEEQGRKVIKTLPKASAKKVDFVPWFQKQFTGLAEAELKLKKDGGKVDAITGATVSSKASLGAVKEAVRLLREHAK